ncbi:maleylacetate reductase [Corynebacterium crudilactis]|uniref:Maleylacetate reductase n=1 Tax=Corynebacterium crudilactis TaxID=1652495 RepID=A0A172QSR3_9CORY|nr:maleylacetate reductase [Corynebacterium crudilactis]ANE03729.1 maleylacetate reductase [Corynebacterium crudilactis]
MSLKFSHETLGQRVLFGTKQASQYLIAEIMRLEAQNVMVIASNSGLFSAQEIAADIDVKVWHSNVKMHVPMETAIEARAIAVDNDIDVIVSVGGGSAVGLAKAIALTTSIPIIAIPTTYAGSEATNVWGITESARKTTGVDNKVVPTTVIYDSSLTMSLPVEMSVASGLNGMAHCIDSLWAPHADPINALMAAEGIRALSAGLPKIVADPQDISGRDEVLYGAYFAAVSFASAGSGLHHKICHVLGGTFNLPHAQTHATVLPYVLAFNAPFAPDAEQRTAAAFGTDTALEGLQKLRAQVGAPQRLSDYGFTEEGIPEAVSIILEKLPAHNPREITEENLTALLVAALNGNDPATLN